MSSTHDPELAAVENALDTLALASSDAALQKTLTSLLPAFLSALSTRSNAARTKIIQSLQHINVRLRAAPSVSLPFTEILNTAVAQGAAPITTNVAITGGYVRRAFRTRPQRERADSFVKLVEAAAVVSSGKNAQDLHKLALDALEDACILNPVGANNPLGDIFQTVGVTAVDKFLHFNEMALRGLADGVGEMKLVGFLRLCEEYASGSPERAAKVLMHMMLAAGSGKTRLAAAGESAMKKVDGAERLVAEEPGLVDKFFEVFLQDGQEVGVRSIILSKGLLRVPLCASCFPEVVNVVQICLETPGLGGRVRGLGMQFLSFVVSHAEREILAQGFTGLVNVLLRLLKDETGGSPSFGEKLRAFGYTGLAELVVKVPEILGNGHVTEALFFEGALDNSAPAEMRVAASSALVTLTRVVRLKKTDDGERRGKVLETLFKVVNDTSELSSSARAAAVQWANECFEFSDAKARMVDIVASSDVRQDVRQHAASGLSPARWKAKKGFRDGGGSPEQLHDFPKFAEVVEIYVSSDQKPLRSRSVAAYLMFALSALKHEIKGEDSMVVIHADSISEYFVRNPGSLEAFRELLSTTYEMITGKMTMATTESERATLSVILFASKIEKLRREISVTYAESVDVLLALIERKSASGDSIVARAGAHLVGIASETMPHDILKATLSKLNEGLQPNPSGTAAGRHGEDHRVAKVLSLGQIIARSLRRKDLTWDDVENSELSVSCMHVVRRITLAVESSDFVRTAACIALTDVGVSNILPLPVESRSMVMNTLSGVLKLHSSSPRLVEASADAIGRICVGEPRSSFKQIALKSLLGVCRERKEEEIRFTASESLVRCASGFDAPPPAVVEAEESASLSSIQKNQAEDLLAVVEMRTDLVEVKEEIADEKAKEFSSIPEVVRAVVNLCQDERPNARAGGCVCLFTFLRLLGVKNDQQKDMHQEVQFMGEQDRERLAEKQKALQDMLPAFQQAFTMLLGDRSDFVQQLASCGVAFVYDMCPPKQQRDLVSTLVRSLTSGKARAASVVPGDQGALLELGGINTKETVGSRAATYKELCTIAQDMGQPELVYKFMDLAGHAALWNSRRGAALAGSALLDSDIAAEQLRPHAKNLLPRLYVYCYDPTESVRIAMGSVLAAVVKSAGFGSVSEALSGNFPLIINHVLKSLSSRQWRTREAACGALRDAMVSRTWDDVKELLRDFWYMTTRALDDIKESVRKAAGGTSRSLSELSIHLCDPKQVGSEVAEQAIGIVIPSILPAFTHQVDEVRLMASSTLAKIIRSGGSALTSSIPEIVEALLEAATELEPQVLNYAEFHVQDKDELNNLRVGAASMSSSPVNDSLERLASLVEEPIIERLIQKLVRISRIGVGIPTRSATARFFSTLLRTRAVIVEPHARLLMFAAAAAAEMEHNMALRNLWCAAVGGAAKLSKPQHVGSLVQKIVTLSGSEDPGQRSLASSLALGVWNRSPETARQHATSMLPIAYMGRYESDEDAKGASSNWEGVWNEGCPSTEAGLRLYAREITSICKERLATSSQYRVKKSAAVALGALAEASNESVDIAHLRSAAKSLIDALPGHIWDGKIAALEALGTIGSSYSNLAVWEECEGGDTVVRTLLEESKRGKKDYRLMAISSATKVLGGCRHKFDLFENVTEDLSDLWKKVAENSSLTDGSGETDASRLVWETGSDANAFDARNKARKAQKALCISAITCLESSYAGDARPKSQIRQLHLLIAVFESIFRNDWEVRLAATHALRRAILRTEGGVLLSGMEENGSLFLSRVVALSEAAVTDGKYAAIRRGGLGLLIALSERINDQSAVSKHLPESLVEAVKVCKEEDSNSSVQGDAKKVCSLFLL